MGKNSKRNRSKKNRRTKSWLRGNTTSDTTDQTDAAPVHYPLALTLPNVSQGKRSSWCFTGVLFFFGACFLTIGTYVEIFKPGEWIGDVLIFGGILLFLGGIGGCLLSREKNNVASPVEVFSTSSSPITTKLPSENVMDDS